MSKQLSIAEARGKLDNLVHDAELGEATEITRGDERVAVLLSWQEYERLAGPQPPLPPRKSPWTAYQEWRRTADFDAIGDPDEVWGNVRDPSPGRDVDL
ncbi:MAG TPA: type II toxin-antitoxin system prevent-host-death family antitoxin [Thermoanaerobaculia bacterium]|nr:type II toxin-antitoxin system prevent-host-death family antitoxin [Thermoanaerobaculia bacterium]